MGDDENVRGSYQEKVSQDVHALWLGRRPSTGSTGLQLISIFRNVAQEYAEEYMNNNLNKK